MLKELEVIENYVNKEFEDAVLALIPEKIVEGKDRNQILRYGARRPYGTHHVSKIIPGIFNFDLPFDSVTINEYKAGQRIDWHKDVPDGGNAIYIISLLSDGVLKFRKDGEIKEFFLPRYSLAIMSEELRYTWEHYFEAEQPRISIVLRKSRTK